MAAEEKWYFSKEHLLTNTPSRRCGCSADKELSYRQQAANFIQDMGQKLQVTQLCINTAIVYMHRFYVFHSFTQFHRNAIASAALFLAAKVEEQPRKLEHVIKVAHMCLNRDHRDVPPLDTKSEQYLEQAQDLVFNENVLLQTLGFDVAIDHPHTHVVRCCELVRDLIVTCCDAVASKSTQRPRDGDVKLLQNGKQISNEASKDLAQTSYFMASNSLHLTTMCLQYKPTIVACFCIHLACKWSNWEIALSSEGKEWFWYVDKNVTMDQLERLTAEFLIIFDKCPTKLKRKIMSIKKENAPFPSQNTNNNLFADPRKCQGADSHQEGPSSTTHHHPPLQPPADKLLPYGGGSIEEGFKKCQQVQSSSALRHMEYSQQQHLATPPPPPSQAPHQRVDAREYRDKKERDRLLERDREKLAQAQVPGTRDVGHHGGAALQNLHHKAVPPKVGAPASHHRPLGSVVTMPRDAARREQAHLREASKRDSIPRDLVFTPPVRHEPAPDLSSEASGSQQNHVGNAAPGGGGGSGAGGRNEWPVDGEVGRDDRHGDKRHGKVPNEHARISQVFGENRYKDNVHSNSGYNHRQDHIRHRSEQYHSSSQASGDLMDRKPPPELAGMMDRKLSADVGGVADRKPSVDLINIDRKPPSEPSIVDRRPPVEVSSMVDRKLQPEVNTNSSTTDRKLQSELLSGMMDRHDASKRLLNVHPSLHVPTIKREIKSEENVDVKPRALSNSIPTNKLKPRCGSPVVGQPYGQSSSSGHKSKSPGVPVPAPRTSGSTQSHHHHAASVRNGPVPEESRPKRLEQPLSAVPKLVAAEHAKAEADPASSRVQTARSSTPVGHKGPSTPDKTHSVRESPYPQRSAKSRQRTPPSSARRPPLLETPNIPPVSSGGGLTSPFGSPPPPLPTTPGKLSAGNNSLSGLRTTRHRSSSSSSEPELIPVVTKLDDIAGYENIIHEAKMGIKLPGRVPDIIQPIRDRKKDESAHGVNSKTVLATSVAKELKPPDLIRPFATQAEVQETQPAEVGPVSFSPSPLDVEVPEASGKQSVDLNASSESVIDVISVTEPLPTLPLLDESAPGVARDGSASPKKSSDHHHRSDKKKKKEKHKHKEKDKSRDKEDKDRKHKHKHKDKDKGKTDRLVDALPAAEPIKITIPKDKLVNLTPTLEQSSCGSSGIKLKIQKERLKDLPQTTSNLSQSASSAGSLKIKITGISSSSEPSRKRDRSSPGDEPTAGPAKSARLSSGEHSKRGSHGKQNGVDPQQAGAATSRARGSHHSSGNKVVQKLADLQSKGKSSSASQP